jgi:flagellar biosynthesis/type III secretory pathway M-ring protein FliF/YscJ
MSRSADARSSENRKGWLLLAGVVVLVVIAIIVVRPYLTSPEPVAPEAMSEPPLPNDPVQARQEIEQRAMGDYLAGMSEEDRKRRHEARLEQLKEMQGAESGGDE